MPEKLSAWRDKLGEKARKEPKFRFYSLYGLVTHPDTLKGLSGNKPLCQSPDDHPPETAEPAKVQAGQREELL